MNEPSALADKYALGNKGFPSCSRAESARSAWAALVKKHYPQDEEEEE